MHDTRLIGTWRSDARRTIQELASQQVTFAFILPAVGIGIDMVGEAAYAVPSQVHVTLAPRSFCHGAAEWMPVAALAAIWSA